VRFTFASIGNPSKYGYAYDTEDFDTRDRINSFFRMFETYGDGLIQHSHDWSIGPEHLADYLVSLAAHLVEHMDLVSGIGMSFRNRQPVQTLDFAIDLRHNPAKYQWYSIDERKVSANGNKYRHDRRYEVLESWVDGTPQHVLRLLRRDYHSTWDELLNAHYLRLRLFEREMGAVEFPTTLIGLSDDGHYGRSVWRALEACINVMKAYDALEAARTSIANANAAR
jgi:hypothetical protein